MMDNRGHLPSRYAGPRTLPYVLFADPGGMNTIARLSFPDATSSIALHSSSWCSAGGSSGAMYRQNSVQLFRAARRARISLAASCGDIGKFCIRQVRSLDSVRECSFNMSNSLPV